MPTKPISPLTATAARGAERRRGDDEQPGAGRVQAEGAGLLRAHPQHVQHPPVGEQHQHAHHQVRQRQAARRASWPPRSCRAASCRSAGSRRHAAAAGRSAPRSAWPRPRRRPGSPCTRWPGRRRPRPPGRSAPPPPPRRGTPRPAAAPSRDPPATIAIVAPEPRTGRHPEQVRVGQRVAQHALVGRAAGRQRAPTSAASTTRGSRRFHTMAWSTGEHRGVRAEAGARARCRSTCIGPMDTGPMQAARTTAPTSTRRRDRVGKPQRAIGGAPARRRRSSARVVMLIGCSFISAEMVCIRSTMRGPQREAMSSSSATIRPSLTADIVDQPGRCGHRFGGLLAALGVGQEHVVRVRLHDVLLGQLRVARRWPPRPWPRRRCCAGRAVSSTWPMKVRRGHRVVGLVELVVVRVAPAGGHGVGQRAISSSSAASTPLRCLVARGRWPARARRAADTSRPDSAPPARRAPECAAPRAASSAPA